jgi:hypothetical protein
VTQPKRKKQLHKQPPTGSTTNASDAVDDIELPPNPSAEEKLDAGVQETFPASDPVSIAQPSETAYEREKRLKRGRSR